MIRLKLKPGREASVVRRHPWLFSGAVGSREGDGSDGVAEVVDSEGRALARGSYSPESQIVARLWTFDGRSPDASLFRERFEAARRLRRELVTPETTGFRAINSEGDLCPGVLMDLYGDVAVLELLTEGTEKWEADLTKAAQEVFNPARSSSAEPVATVTAAPLALPVCRLRERAAGRPVRARFQAVLSLSPKTAFDSWPTSPAARRPDSFSISARTASGFGPSPPDERS